MDPVHQILLHSLTSPLDQTQTLKQTLHIICCKTSLLPHQLDVTGILTAATESAIALYIHEHFDDIDLPSSLKLCLQTLSPYLALTKVSKALRTLSEMDHIIPAQDTIYDDLYSILDGIHIFKDTNHYHKIPLKLINIIGHPGWNQMLNSHNLHTLKDTSSPPILPHQTLPLFTTNKEPISTLCSGEL